MNEFIKRYWKVGLCFLGVFLAGSVAGGFVTAGVIKRNLVKRVNPNHWQELVMGTLDRKLDLRPDQRAKIEPMVADVVRECRATRMEALVRYGRALGQLKENVSTVLDADQQKKLDELAQARERRWKQFLVPDANP